MGQPSRSADDLTLLLVRHRCSGMTTQQIADRTGLTDTYIRTATNRVLEADTAESGEDVAAAYWPVTRGKMRAA